MHEASLQPCSGEGGVPFLRFPEFSSCLYFRSDLIFQSSFHTLTQSSSILIKMDSKHDDNLALGQATQPSYTSASQTLGKGHTVLDPRTSDTCVLRTIQLRVNTLPTNTILVLYATSTRPRLPPNQ